MTISLEPTPSNSQELIDAPPQCPPSPVDIDVPADDNALGGGFSYAVQLRRADRVPGYKEVDWIDNTNARLTLLEARRILENKSEMALKLTDNLSVHVTLDDSPPVC